MTHSLNCYGLGTALLLHPMANSYCSLKQLLLPRLKQPLLNIWSLDFQKRKLLIQLQPPSIKRHKKWDSRLLTSGHTITEYPNYYGYKKQSHFIPIEKSFSFYFIILKSVDLPNLFSYPFNTTIYIQKYMICQYSHIPNRYTGDELSIMVITLGNGIVIIICIR